MTIAQLKSPPAHSSVSYQSTHDDSHDDEHSKKIPPLRADEIEHWMPFKPRQGTTDPSIKGKLQMRVRFE
jgi:hypothetical protein